MPIHIIVKDTRTMEMTIDQQVALDEALVPYANKLRIGKSNFRLRSDITSKDSTLRLEFWATAIVHHHSIRFKMDNKKRIVNLECFREMLHICPRLHGQTFDELPFEEEILAPLRFLGHNGEIRKLTDVNINKLHQPWRSFAVVINKCLNIKNSKAYKEYYVIALGATPPKTKASVRKTKSSFDTIITPPTATGTRLSTSAKGKQPTKSSKAKDEGTGIILGVLDVPTDESDEEISWKSSDEDDDDEVDERSDDQDDDADQDDDDQNDDNQDDNDNDQDTDNDDDDFVHPNKEGHDAEDNDDELYRDVNINLEGQDVQITDVHTTQEFEDTHVTLTLINPDGIDSLFETTPRVDVQASTTVVPLTLTAPTLPPPTIPTMSEVPQAPTPLTTTLSTFLQDLLNFGSLFRFDYRLKTLEANFSEFVKTNQFARAVSSIPEIVERYMDQRINEAVKVAVQIQSNRIQDEAQAKNKEFLKNIDENIQKIIKEQVKEQVKVQVSKILPKIEKTVNEQLEAEVLTRSSNSSKTSYVVAADLSEMELKKILIEKMESNKRRDDADKDEEPSAGSDRGSKRRIEGKEPESTSAPKEKATKTTGKSTQGSKSHQKIQQKKPLTPDLAWNKTLPATHGSIQPWISDLTKQTDSRSSFNEMMDTPVDFLAFLINRLKVDTLTPVLLADQLDWNNPDGQRYLHNMLKPLSLIPNSRGLRVIPFDHFINNDLKYLRGGASSHKYTTSVTKTKAADYGHIKWIDDLVPRTMWSQEPVGYDKYPLSRISHWGRKCQQFYGFAVNRESARDVYSKRRIIAVTELQIVEWHDYKHLDWIMVRRDDDKLYKFKEGDFKRLCIQDIEDMLLLLV
nr:hypothetical protein [Tanacetum cinerariifolium]